MTVRHSQRYSAVASGSLDQDDDPDVEFDFGLARILDGLETLIDAY